MTRRLHRLLRRLLPPDFREAWGAEMEDAFADAMASARRRGWRARGALWLREVVDLARTGRRLRSEARRHGAGFVARRSAGTGAGTTMGLVDDVRYAVRSLVRKPALSLFAVGTIALGIGATTAMFSTVESVVLNPLPFEDGDRMVGLFRQVGGGSAFITPRPEDVERWAEQRDVFEVVEPWSTRSFTLTGRGDPVELNAALIRPSYHDLIGVVPAVGRIFDDDELRGEGARVLLLSHAFAARTFGSPEAALDATLTLDGEPWTVVGVMPRGILLPGWGLQRVALWGPLSDEEAATTTPALALLREGVTAEQANERFAALEDPDDELASRGYASLVSDQVSRNIRDYLGLLMTAVALLLLVSCVNVSNLLLFRANARKRETAVRSALGGARGRLTRQLLVESLLLAGAGGVAGVGVAVVGQAGILRLRPGQLEVLDYASINGSVLAFAFLVSLATGLAFGLVPALQAARPGVLDPLRSGVRTEGDVVGGRLRWVLVSSEVALSFALLIGALTVLSTLVERQRVDFGYAIDELVVMQTTSPRWKYTTLEEREAVYAGLLDRLRALPGVARVTHSAGVPPRTGVFIGRIEVEGRGPLDDLGPLHGPWVQDGYFRTLGQRVVRGRTYSPDDLAGEESLVVLGESTARALFADADPVGGRFRMGGDDEWFTVIGVVADVPMTGLSTEREVLQAYHPFRSVGYDASILIRVAPDADTDALIPLAREMARATDPDLRVNLIGGARELQYQTLERERFVTTIMAVFATFALLLAAVGLYGVVSQVVGQRTREIGIRIALGAGRSAIFAMVLERVGSATLAGIVLGSVLAIGGVRVLETRIVRAAPEDWPTFVLAATALALTALLAAYGPARRATRVDPVASMRVE